MDKTTLFINNILAHASENYDPVKAREYYLRTRQLKGRKAGSAPNPMASGRRSRQVTTGLVKQKLKALSIKYRQEARAVFEEAKTKLARANESEAIYRKNSAEQKAKDLKMLSDETSRKIAALPKVPKGANATTRARIEKQRVDGMAKINSENAQKTSKINTDAKEDLEYGLREIDDHRKEIRDEANAKLAKVLVNMNKSRTQLLSQTKNT